MSDWVAEWVNKSLFHISTLVRVSKPLYVWLGVSLCVSVSSTQLMCLFLSSCQCVYVCGSACLSLCLTVSLVVWIYNVCLQGYVSDCVNISVLESLFACVSDLCISVFIRVFVCMPVSVTICQWSTVCLYVYLYACLSVCLYACLYASLCWCNFSLSHTNSKQQNSNNIFIDNIYIYSVWKILKKKKKNLFVS